MLPKIQDSESLGISGHDYSTHKFEIEKTRQTIKQQVSQKIEKKFRDLNLNFNIESGEKDKIEKKDTKDKADKETVSDSSWPIKSDIVKYKNKVDKSLISVLSQNLKKNLETKYSKTFGSGFLLR